MVRTFRSVGAQFITMFSYDMLETAPYNLGWQTHFLNLVYSPRKAVSAIIAAEATRALPRFLQYGDYPDNCRFGPFRVSYEQDTSEMATAEKFIYANDTNTRPPEPAALNRIVGLGSSPVMASKAMALISSINSPTAFGGSRSILTRSSFRTPSAQHLNYQTVSSRLIWREWPMLIHLPDLGNSF